MKFESELQKGNFIVGNCHKCNKVIWPPSDYCDNCFGNLNWKKIQPEGRLVEYSKTDNEVFCVAELDGGIRIMGTLIENSVKPEIGSKIRIEKCGIKNGNYSFVIRLY